MNKYLATLTSLLFAVSYAFPTLLINEIRIDQGGGDDDEYFELSGTPGESLEGVTYLVLGDSPSGKVEAVVALSGTVPASGLFVASEATFTLGTADAVFTGFELDFENSDNVTHLLVTGFTGVLDESLLDDEQDGTLDTTPWTSVLDAVSLIETVGTGDLVYAVSLGGADIGPDGTFVPGHVFRDRTSGDWVIGDFDLGVTDTPGAANPSPSTNAASPVATGEAATVSEGGSVSTLDNGAASLLDNDTDADGDTLILDHDPATDPLHGTVDLLANGTFTYTHDGSSTTTDSFVYTVNDGSGGSDTALVIITITLDQNDPPVGVDDIATVDEGGSISTVNGGAASLLANDTDPEDDSLTLSAAPVTPPARGTVILAAEGTFTYTHDGTETTTDSFQYELSDGEFTATAWVYLNVTPVNDQPIAVDDATSADEGGTVSVLAGGVTSVLANDSDIEGDNLTVTSTGAITTANGVVTLDADGLFTYEHDGSETTSDFFDYTVSDGTDSRNARVSITVNPVSDEPPVANPDSAATTEGGSASVLDSGADSVLDNDTDEPDNTPLSVINTGVNATDHGTVNLAANGEFTYTHDGSETTSDFFVYSLTDGTDARATTVTIAIEPVNDAPQANDDAAAVDEGGTTSELTGGVTSVLANDTDAEDDDLTVTNPGTWDTLNGTVTLEANGEFTYTHDDSETTTDSFDYILSDGGIMDFEFAIDSDQVVNDLELGSSTPSGSGTATFDPATSLFEWTITYDGLTGPATAMHFHGPAAPGEAAGVDLGISLSDSPVEGSATLTAENVATLQSGMWYLNIHTAANPAGEIRGQVNAVDTATVNITINPVNEAPVANDDHMTVSEGGSADNLDDGSTSVLDNDTDRDLPGDTLTASLWSGPSHGTLTLNANGTFDYENDGNEFYTDSFVYVLDDNVGITTTATVDIWVTLVNDNNPVANDDIATTTKGGTVSSPNVLANDTDADIDAVLTVNTTPVSDVDNGTLVLGADGYFTYTHDGGTSTTDSFTYEMGDGEDTDEATVNIGIFDPINITEQPMDATITTGQSTVLTAVTDATGDNITYQWYQGESGDTSTPLDDSLELPILDLRDNLVDDLSATTFINGNDALVLKKDGVIIDMIGVVGVDPAAGFWGSGDVTTSEDTLIRKSSVTSGDADGFVGNEDDLTGEWDGFAQDTFDDLGMHTADAAATDLFFSEYIEGSGNNKAYEIYNGTGAVVDLTDYAVESYNNGATDPNHTLPLIDIADDLADGAVLVIVNDAAAGTLTLGTADGEFDTGALDATTSFWVRVSNGNITADSDTATVTVLDVFSGVPIDGFKGWKASPWYKNYFVGFWPWIYHDEAGWQYVSDVSLEETIFVWDLGFGEWVFLNEESWRFMYIFSRSPFLPEGYYFSFAGNTTALRFFQNPDDEIISIPPSN